MWRASAPDLAAVAGALAAEARAAMALALLDGRAWTLSELAVVSGTAASTASAHVDRLIRVGLVEEVRRDRHRYLRIAAPVVAEAIETFAALSGAVHPASHGLGAQRADRAVREVRSCYRHLAGQLGTQLCDGGTSRWIRGSGLDAHRAGTGLAGGAGRGATGGAETAGGAAVPGLDRAS